MAKKSAKKAAPKTKKKAAPKAVKKAAKKPSTKAKPKPKAVKKPVKKTVTAKKKSAPKPKATKKAAKKPAPKKAIKKVAKPEPKQERSALAIIKGKIGQKLAAHKPQTIVGKSSRRRRDRRKIVIPPRPVYVPKRTTPKFSTATQKPAPKTELPMAIVKENKKHTKSSSKVRYSDAELREFKEIITTKLDDARKELKYYQDQINRSGDNSTEDTENKFATMEDGSSTLEREYLNQMAARQAQFIDHLDKALLRIDNKSYGICRVTGKLIEKERLMVVPHTTLSIEGKMLEAKQKASQPVIQQNYNFPPTGRDE